MNASTGGQPAAPPLADFILLNEEIAALVRARIPLESHLAQLGSELPGKSGELARRIGRQLESGESLDRAMDAECPALPPSYRAVILVGMKSGQLAGSLEALAESAARIDSIRRATGAALLYPLIMLVLACLLLPIIVLGVLPSFELLGRYQLRSLMWLGETPLLLILLLALIPLGVLFMVARWWRRTGRLGGTSLKRSRWLEWFPGASRVRRWSQLAVFADLLVLLVERGLPLEQSLELVADVTEEPRLREAARRLCGEIRSGELATARPEDTSDFPLLIQLALRHQSDRPLLLGSLRQAAAIYHDRALRSAEWFAEYAPILLTVAIGGTATIAFTLLVFWPYSALLQEIGQSSWR